jgi:hypothetical protein
LQKQASEWQYRAGAGICSGDLNKLKMRTLILILVTAFVFGCQAAREKPTYVLPSEKEITQLFETILSEDSSFVSNSSINGFALKQPKKLRIDFAKENSQIPPPPPEPGEVYLIDLFKLEADSRPVFSEEDYNYLRFQQDSFAEFQWSKDFLAKYSIVADNDSSEREVYSFSNPIFNSDNTYAYLQESQYSAKNWLGTRYFILNKQEGKWRIIKSEFLSTR